MSCVLCMLMFTGILPAGLEVSASAGVSDYCSSAAVEWALEHWNDIDSVLLGKGYYSPKDGGDCANFVSQCIYMGGLDMNTSWNSSGYKAHYSSSSDGSFIRAHQLYNYVVSLGGTSVRNPSASDVSVGDLIFYKTTNDGKMHHSAIVVDIENGTPVIAAHSTMKNGVEVRYKTTDWHCSVSGDRTYLVQMNGSPCVAPNPRSFDVYTASSSQKLRTSASASSSALTTFLKGEYAHVYETKTVSGVEWGKTQRYGKWGWVKLSGFNYQRHVESYSPSHIFGDWHVVKQSNCRENGYEERVCQRCGYTEQRTITGGHKVTKEPNCLNGSFCDYCGVKVKDALGHNMGSWTTVSAATCLNGGSEKRVCSRCGYSETRSTAALGHNYSGAVSSAPNCVQAGTATYKCTRCSHTYTKLTNASNPWSEWMTADYSSTIPADRIQKKTQYRYRDQQTTKSYSTSMSGWTRGSYELIKDSSKSGTRTYAPEWHDGFDKSNYYYKTYYGTSLTPYENETTKFEVPDDKDYVIGYVYWHWCRGGNVGAIDRKISWEKTSTFDTFHAFYKSGSVVTYYPSPQNAYKIKDTSECTDTYWWNGRESGENKCTYVKQQDYITYNKYYTYTKWGSWSSWQDSSVSSSSTRQVETRTLYRYNLLALGHNFTVDASYPATCTTAGFSGKKCSRCGALDPNGTTIPALGHNMPDWTKNRSEWYKISAEGADTTVYRADCRRKCGYFETREESGCRYVINKTVAPTCTEQGYTLMKCSSHGETLKTNIVSALGHGFDSSLPDDAWITDSVPTCEKAGSMHRDCIRHSACGYTETKTIPAVGHSLSFHEAVAPMCTEDGMKEYYDCSVCHKLFDSDENETTRDKLVDPAKGHTEGEWIRISEPGCGKTGWEEIHCTVCDALLDEREIPGWEHEFEVTEDVESTCIEPGYTIYTCTLCGDEYSELKDLKEHTWGEWDITDTVCIYPGEKTRECTYCHTEEFEEISAEYTEHDLKEVTASDGCKAYECTRCDYKEDGSHKFVRDSANDINPTCTEPGIEAYKCSVCSAVKYIEIPETGHDYKESESVDSTCVTPGYTLMVCANDSSHTYEKYTSQPLGHELGEWYVVTPATYESAGLEQRDCVRSDLTETREIPMKIRHKATFVADGEIIAVVEFEDGATSIDEPDVPSKDRYTASWEKYVLEDKDITINAEYSLIPSDGSSQIDTEKTAEYDPETGDTIIRLTASSDAKTVISKTVKGKPLDIVLVVDQSGSMDGNRTEALKAAAENFINVVNKNAVETDTDHRIAIVGFAMGKQSAGRNYPAYLNSGILTTPDGDVQINRLTDSQTKNSLVSVKTDDGSVNPVLTEAVESIQAYGATAADLGLEMANDIFSLNSAEGRKRVIVFMTDGDPTYASNFDNNVADTAIEQAKLAKNANEAVIYGLNIENYNSTKSKNFINYVSSNYLDASSMNNTGKKSSDKYYLEVKDVSSLSSIFETIAEEALVNTTDFKDVTIIDTVSKYFTLTSAQEKTLKENAIESLGVKYEDISVVRNDDGTTVIRIDHINPVETTVNGKTKYIADFSFTVTSNQNALSKGIYKTNTEDAGVIMPGSDAYEKTFLSPSVRISEDHVAAIFNINGEVFHIVNVLAGAEINAPEFTVESGYTFSGWDVPEGFTLDGGYAVFDSTLTRAQHTLTWIIDGVSQSETLFVGDKIIAPDVKLNSEGMEFIGFDGEVPAYMPDSDLTFNAKYADHEHKYAVKSTTEATCVENGETVYECEICSDTYSETIECTGHHNYYAIVGSAASEVSKTTFKCSTCGEYLNASLSYKFVNERTDYRGKTRAVTYNMYMTDETGIEVQPDGSVTITAVLSNYYPGSNGDVYVRRYNDDGTYTQLPCTVKDGLVTFTTDHFCNFEFVIPADCEDGARHEDYDKDGICDKCGKTVTKADLFRCSMCPKYEKMKDVPVVGIIYSVVHFFVHLAAMISWIT